ncbi:MAG: hypothetical protein ACT4QG_12945 [Sporichthyaceae bacterium]
MGRARLWWVAAACSLAVLSGCGGAQAGPPPELPPDLLPALTGQVGCGTQPIVMVRQYRYDFDADGVEDALAAVRCDTGAGSPPSTVFAIKATPAGAQIVGKLLDAAAGEVVTEVSGQGPEAVVSGFAFSPTAPRCCPDLEVVHRYRWTGQAFDAGVRTATPLPSADPSDELPDDLSEEDGAE